MSHETIEYTLVSHTIRVPYADEPGLKEHDISVNMVTVDDQNPSTLVQMGMGNEGRAPYMGQRYMIKHDLTDTAFIEGLPYASINPNRIQHFAIAATHAASTYLSERNGDKPTSLISDSQAAPGGVWAFEDNPGAYNRIDLLHPLGVVPLTIGKFAGRLLLTGLQWDQLSDPRSLYVGGISIKRAAQDFCRGGTRLDFALNVSLIEPWARIVQKGADDAALYLNHRDKLFPHEEACTVIHLAGLKQISSDAVVAIRDSIQLIDGSHSSPATKAGARQVARIVNENKKRPPKS